MSNEAPDLNGILGNLLANPALLSSLGNLLGGLKPPAPPGCDKAPPTPCEEEGRPFPPPPKGDCESEASATLPFPPPCLPKKPLCREKDPRLCLLTALRPFLSPKRQITLDGLLRIFEILEIVDQMNGGNYV